MKLHELKDSPDDLARYLAVVKQVERMRPGRVIYQSDRQVTCQSLEHEVIERLIQSGHPVLSCPRDKQWYIVWKIGHRFTDAWVDEPELLRGIGHHGGLLEVEHV